MSAQSARRKSAEPNLVECEFAFTDSDFRRIAGQLYEQAGITLSTSKATLVYSRLAKRVRTLGLTSFADYCALIDSPEGGDERRRGLGGPGLLDELFDQPGRGPLEVDDDAGQALAPVELLADVGVARHGCPDLLGAAMIRRWVPSGTVAKILPRTRNDSMPWWSCDTASGSDSARPRTAVTEFKAQYPRAGAAPPTS